MSDFQSIPVSQYMSAPVQSVAASDPLDAVYERLLANKISCFAVVDGETLIGVVSRTDLLREGRRSVGSAVAGRLTDIRHVLLDFHSKTVADVMTANPATVDADANIAQASRTMVAGGVHRVFITAAGTLVGVLSTLDIMAAVRDAGSTERIEHFMSSPVISVDVNANVANAADQLSRANVSGLIVVDNEWPVGVFTQVEALVARDLPDSTLVDDAMDPALICMPITTPMHRAAQQGIRMRVRRIVAAENRHMRGLLSGLDFATFVAQHP